MRLFRLLRILWIVYRYRLDELVVQLDASGRLYRWWQRLFFWRHDEVPRGLRLRVALESLGPIFVKFGQMLSTRRDLIPDDIAEELEKLQDRVPPFPSAQAIAILEQHYGRPLHEVFATFDAQPVASASVAQVHFATLFDGREVAVKVLRPGIRTVIEHDLALMDTAARALEALWREGRRLRPREVVAEFAKTLEDELDLVREGANASQLRRNFRDSALLLVPEVFWDYTGTQVLVLERMHGTPISQIEALKAQGIDLKRLAEAGVEIFCTQVFRDGFFHADMHPGNIFVAADGRYIALDFGIMGTLSDEDKNYLAQNFLAFFNRDYRRVAIAHIEAGWVPPDTRVDEFEAAIRAVCEPIFDRPLKDISFGKTLLRLFQTARRFEMEVQPQLVLLQKTLLNIEGLGRQLDPDLDLWKTFKPFLERWMSEQVGWRALRRMLREEAPQWAQILPQLPRLLHREMEARETQRRQARIAARQMAEQQARLRWRRLGWAVVWLVSLALVYWWAKRG